MASFASLPLVLGSASPRRRELLERMAVPLEICVVDVDESVHPGEAPDAYLIRVVREKLEAVRRLVVDGGRAVLVADTSVVVDDDVLGKPADTQAARAMLDRLNGRTHVVLTRFALASGRPRDRVEHEETVRTEVTFRRVPASRIAAYVATGEGLDKAGAYAIQGGASAFVESIRGSYSSVVGLPACHVAVALERAGILR